jgi:septal ring factor EnvC (AmiA/AmiB activator)
MTTVDLTVELLKQIRDGVYETNARLDQTNARLDQTNARLDRTRTEFLERLDQTNARLDDGNVRLGRLEGQVTDGTVRLGRLERHVAEGLGYMRVLAERDERLADAVADLRSRVEVLEATSRPIP